MKRIILIFAVLALLGIQSKAQNFYSEKSQVAGVNLELANLTTRSIYGWKTGFTLGVSLNNRINVAYVNLMELNGGEESGDTFRGGSFQYFFNPKSRLGFGLGVMAGLYNQQFLAVTPSAEVRYVHNNRLVAGIGYSRVDGYPKFDFKIGIRFFK